MRRAVFLDRDGVINKALVRNHRPYSPMRLEELEIIPGVKEYLTRLRLAGYLLIVVSNQPEVARGNISKEMVDEMNCFLMKELELDAIHVCYHDDNDRCTCRKPSPGLFINAAERLHIDLSRSFMIGDRWRDIEAGKRAGCKTILIDYHYRETGHSEPDIYVESLENAVKWILAIGNNTI